MEKKGREEREIRRDRDSLRLQTQAGSRKEVEDVENEGGRGGRNTGRGGNTERRNSSSEKGREMPT